MAAGKVMPCSNARMTNTYMQEGNEDPQNLIQDLKDGLYAVGFGGGQVILQMESLFFLVQKHIELRMVKSKKLSTVQR